MSKRAVVLAGGKGSRLRPYTVVLPKPLMPIGEYPILEVILRQLASQGFDRVTLAVNYQAEIVRAFCGDGSRWGISVDYSLESVPLSTIAPLCLIRDLPENFLLMNGDVLTDLSMQKLYQEHVSQKRQFTIAASERTNIVDYGVLHARENRLTGFEEKPKFNYLVSMGVYILNRSVLDRVPAGQKYGFDDLMLDMLAHNESVHVEPHSGYWLDIGRVDDYMRAVDEFDDRRKQLLPDEKCQTKNER
jgi:NDP-sugar pyrophosphorylase family protein